MHGFDNMSWTDYYRIDPDIPISEDAPAIGERLQHAVSDFCQWRLANNHCTTANCADCPVNKTRNLAETQEWVWLDKAMENKDVDLTAQEVTVIVRSQPGINPAAGIKIPANIPLDKVCKYIEDHFDVLAFEVDPPEDFERDVILFVNGKKIEKTGRTVTVCCSPYANASGNLVVPEDLPKEEVREYVEKHFDDIVFEISHDYRGIDVDIYDGDDEV